MISIRSFTIFRSLRCLCCLRSIRLREKGGTDEKDKKRKTAMFMLIFVACVIYIITQLFSIQNLLLLSCSQMLGGIAFFFLPYPFISFETFYKVNIKKTVKICKVIGGLLMISAVVFAVLFFV
mgnify:CR=1 FL=1